MYTWKKLLAITTIALLIIIILSIKRTPDQLKLSARQCGDMSILQLSLEYYWKNKNIYPESLQDLVHSEHTRIPQSNTEDPYTGKQYEYQISNGKYSIRFTSKNDKNYTITKETDIKKLCSDLKNL